MRRSRDGKHARYTRQWVPLVCAALVASGCDEEPTAVDRATVAEARLFDAMNHDDFASAGDIVAELYEIRDDDPVNYRVSFLLGATSLWWLAEAGRPEANPLRIIGQAIPLILETFVDVIGHDQANLAGASALLGAFLADSGLGRQQGFELVEQAVALVPEVGLFQRMHVRRFAAVADTLTANAVTAGFQFWEVCAGVPLDHDDPDFTGLVQPPTDEPARKFCWGSERVPHGFEGGWLIFGDLLVKAGQLDAARTAYENARLGVNYDRWKFKDDLEARLVSDLAARAATYASYDPANWAPIGVLPFSCTQCHASRF